MLENILTIGNRVVTFYALRDGDSLYVLDGGFIGGRKALSDALQSQGWAGLKIAGIIVTHGHLDHILNVASLARDHQAWIAAPALDAAHYAGKPVYAGWSLVAAALEHVGRRVLNFEPFQPGHLLNEGDVLPIWDGLKAVPLPGHTRGQMGFFCLRSRLLFSADLFASYGCFCHMPPAILNHDTTQARASLRHALDLAPSGILPNHGDRSTPTTHLQRLRQLADRLGV